MKKLVIPPIEDKTVHVMWRDENFTFCGQDYTDAEEVWDDNIGPKDINCKVCLSKMPKNPVFIGENK